MKRTKLAVALAVAMAFVAQDASAQSIRGGFNGSTLPGNDDGSTGLVGLGFDANFFGDTYNTLFVNNNGNVTFDLPMSTYSPFALLTTNRVLLAPFFADVDTRNGNPVTYGAGSVGGRTAFGVNWLGVGYYSGNIDRLNSFQLVIIDRSDTGVGNFDFEFNYGSIQWDYGEATNASNTARVGWSNGTTESYELAGSGLPGAFLDGGQNELNGDRYLFQVRNGQIENPQVVPEPITMVLLGSGLAGIGAVRRRRREELGEEV